MSVSQKMSYPNGDATCASVKKLDYESDENAFCTKDNFEASLCELSEELSSFGIASTTPINLDDPQDAEPLKQLSIKLINSTWSLIHKHRSLLRIHEKTVLSNNRTCSDNLHLKNQVTRLKEDLQKKEQALHDSQAKENRLKEHLRDSTRDLKREKEETRKLRKQAQSKEVQHEHEVRRILQNNQKLQEQLQKSAGVFVPRESVLKKAQTDQEKKLASYQKTICRLQENNRQMLEEINNLKEDLALYKESVDLQIEASGTLTDVKDEFY